MRDASPTSEVIIRSTPLADGRIVHAVRRVGGTIDYRLDDGTPIADELARDLVVWARRG
jgi:hypothetical protein